MFVLSCILAFLGDSSRPESAFMCFQHAQPCISQLFGGAKQSQVFKAQQLESHSAHLRRLGQWVVHWDDTVGGKTRHDLNNRTHNNRQHLDTIITRTPM